jgi:acetyl-CoA carboxylase carboxyl transferase subunit alpha
MKHQLDFEKADHRTAEQAGRTPPAPGKTFAGHQFRGGNPAHRKKAGGNPAADFLNLTAWQRVQLARHPKRPYTLDYIGKTFTDFQELHGDRLFRRGPRDGRRLCQTGRTPRRRHRHAKRPRHQGKHLRNFGSAHPEGYRKALRLMRLANKFGLPIITLIDTAGAYPGVGAEERHIAEAIAVNLREMMLLEVPIIAAVIGEGGSGGALGIGVADRVLILENAYYSVISPEGCAAILWKDRANAAKAAAALKITAKDLFGLKLVDEIVPEPLGGAHTDPGATAVKSENAPAQASRRNSRAAGRRTVEKALRKIPRPRAFLEKIEPPAEELRPAVSVLRRAAPINLRALSAHFSSDFQGTRLGRTRNRAALRQKTSAGKLIGESWEIRPARRRKRHRQRPARRKKSALAHGKSRARIARRRKTGGGKSFPAAVQNSRRARKTFAASPSARRKAAELKGEPKTEMWFIADAAPGAELLSWASSAA